MDFDYRYAIAFIFAASAFFEAVTIRKRIQKVNDNIDELQMRLIEMQDQVKEILHQATGAKQVSLNAWEDAKKRHAEVISSVDSAKSGGSH